MEIDICKTVKAPSRYHGQLFERIARSYSQFACPRAAATCPRAVAAHHKHTPVSEVVQEAVNGGGRQQAAGVQVCKHSG